MRHTYFVTTLLTLACGRMDLTQIGDGGSGNQDRYAISSSSSTADLVHEMRDIQHDNRGINDTAATLSVRCESIETRIAEFNRILSERSGGLGTLTARKVEILSELLPIEESISLKYKAFGELQGEYDAKKRSLELTSGSNLASEIAKRRKSIVSEKRNLVRQLRQTVSQRNNINFPSPAYTDLTQQIDKLGMRISQLNTEYSVFEEVLRNQAQLNRTKLQAEIDAISAKMAALSGEITVLLAKCTPLRSELAAVESRIQNLNLGGLTPAVTPTICSKV